MRWIDRFSCHILLCPSCCLMAKETSWRKAHLPERVFWCLHISAKKSTKQGIWLDPRWILVCNCLRSYLLHESWREEEHVVLKKIQRRTHDYTSDQQRGKVGMSEALISRRVDGNECYHMGLCGWIIAHGWMRGLIFLFRRISRAFFGWSVEVLV